jgi:hypothetical protein
LSQFDELGPSISANTFITAVSEHDATEDVLGRLSMWRAFGGHAARVAIIFAIPRITLSADVLGIFFSPVAYYPSAVVANSVMDRVVANINSNRPFLQTIGQEAFENMTFQMFVVAVTCLKHPGFREECEWRAVYNPRHPLLHSRLIERSHEVVYGIPQTVCKIPLDIAASPDLSDVDFPNIFERLIIGPTQYASAMSEAFAEALSTVGVQDSRSRVVLSDIPIRT